MKIRYNFSGGGGGGSANDENDNPTPMENSMVSWISEAKPSILILSKKGDCYYILGRKT